MVNVNGIAIHKYPWFDTLAREVGKLKPKITIDFGTKSGATAIVLASVSEKVLSYDCWDENIRGCLKGHNYHIEQAMANTSPYPNITLACVNFWEWISDPEPFDVMYLDIDNDGEKLIALYDAIPRGTVFFEGGSHQRDEVHWMKDRLKMQGSIRYEVIDTRFPSLSMFTK